MALPLVVLAIGSVVAGFVGVPHALGGHNLIEGFLHPSFEAHLPAPGTGSTVLHGGASTGGEGDVAIERRLMFVSTGIAVAGIGIAAYFWLRRREAAAALARQFSGVHTLLDRKYYVDEIYDAVVVQPLKRISTGGLWRGVDEGMIDGTVNGVGSIVQGGSSTLRRLQTGSVRTYAASLFLGAVMILGWYLWL
jgi:NADH-quinone oxidoreductase subunit L